MIDFAAARRMMVDCQVRTADVTDLRLIAAMGDLPREVFVPANKADLSYLDLDLAVAEGAGRAGRCLLKPMVLAKLVQIAEIVRIRPCARCRLRHGLLVGGAGAASWFGGRAGAGCVAGARGGA